MILDAVSFGVIAVVIAVLLRPRFPRQLSEGRSVMADLRAGFGYLRRTPSIRALVVALSGLNLYVSPVLAVGLVLRTQDAGWSATSLGVFEATSGVAAAIGALIVLRWKPPDSARTGLLVLVAQAAACAAIGSVPYPVIFVSMATIGVTAGIASALLSGYFTAAVDESYLSRCTSIVLLTDQALMPAVMTGFGVLIAGVGVATACLIAGAMFAAARLAAADRPTPVSVIPG